MAVANYDLTQNRPPAAERGGLRVMVVDPQAESRSLLKAAMRSIQTVDSVRESGTPSAMEDMLRETPMNVVFIEEHLGSENVFELVKEIKGQAEFNKLNFVLMSHDLNVDSRQQGMAAGILGYLSKPFDIRGLEAALRDAMGKVATNHKETLNRVRRIEFFSDFTDMELVRLLKICHTRKFSAGETVFSEGEIGDRFYVVLSGSADVLKQRRERVDTLMTLGPGDCFGEMAIVDSEPRSADVKANTDATLIEVNAQIMKDVNDILALKIYRKLALLVTKKLRDYTTHSETA